MSTPKEPRRRVDVLDTSAFLAGYDPFSVSNEQVTVPKVEDEIRRNSMVKVRFQTALESGKVKVKAPDKNATEQAKAEACKSGDYHKLSETDIELLSLALELKIGDFRPQIISDDYSIQNVARQLGIEFSAIVTFGIKRHLEWVQYCPACFKQYPAGAKFRDCQICGSKLKRKTKKKD
jgi:UPF0271 protein